jgi:hypothetical protein
MQDRWDFDMAARTWQPNSSMSMGDLNHYVRDKGQVSLCIATYNKGTIGSGKVGDTKATGPQSIPTNIATALSFDAEIIDTDGMHSTNYTPDTFVPPVPGWYIAQGWVMYGAGVGYNDSAGALVNFRNVLIVKNTDFYTINGGGSLADVGVFPFFTPIIQYQSLPIYCNGADYLNVFCYIQCGSLRSLSVVSGIVAIYRLRG